MRQKVLSNLRNILGWHTSRKIVVIESDDWGSTRIPSIKTYDFLVSNGIIPRDNKPFNEYDTLASPDDLNALFETLSSFSDINNNPCVFTAACNVANPDFKKIKDNDFSKYFYEPFTQTLNRYFANGKSFDLWKEGISNKVFIPQFHGREHLNVNEWMRALQEGDHRTRLCFDHEVWTLERDRSKSSSISYRSAFDFYYLDDLEMHIIAIREGLNMFKDIFGYGAEYFVPPNGQFSRSLEGVTAQSGIKYLCTSNVRAEPLGHNKKRTIIHFLGQKNNFNQIYIIRNCFFEPIIKGKDWVDSCLSDMNIAFRWNKPAIISSHRANFIGVHDFRNRDGSLQELKKLLHTAKRKWPDIEFISSVQLGKLISEE